MQRKNIHESRYASSLIEASLDPLFTISKEGKIMDMNEATVNATGKTYEELIGTDFFNYFTEPQKAMAVYNEVFEKGFVKNYPLTIKDHKLTDVLFNGSVYKDGIGKVLGAVVVARDITDQKRIAAELTDANLFAESERLKAENAMKAKQQFLSNMSHEIRTPMNAIIGFTKVVLKTDLSAKQREYIDAIKTSGDALIVLINDILDLAKVDAGKMSFEQVPFRMASSISAMLQLFDTKIQEKNLELKIDYDKKIPEILIGDPVRLHQIILNLVSNAVKFTNKGEINVSVRLIKDEQSSVMIEFSVEDTGIGIPQNKLNSIFENFQQASISTSRLYGGTGLGLAIVKQLVEPQGGQIHVESKLGLGSKFMFTLSFQKAAVGTKLEQVLPEAQEEIKDFKVLVVEDIPLNQLLMKTLLDDFGFERDIAENGKIAIEKLKTNTYDVILMDLQMPEMNGFEATEYIRKTLGSDVPIIALTADVTTADLEKCTAVGMNDYIAKPVDEKLLYQKIVGLFRKTELEKFKVAQLSETKENKSFKYIDMTYLNQRTKSNPKLIIEMISLYLEQTPGLIALMRNSFEQGDWSSLHAAAHKMIPSFSIMGISSDFENIARKVQEYAPMQQKADGIHDMILNLEQVCLEACQELEEELNRIKKINV
jgi:PAS domain S-box-containing protein